MVKGRVMDLKPLRMASRASGRAKMAEFHRVPKDCNFADLALLGGAALCILLAVWLVIVVICYLAGG